MPTVIEISNIFSKFNSVKNIYDITSKICDCNCVCIKEEFWFEFFNFFKI